jgi:hypothetical protein
LLILNSKAEKSLSISCSIRKNIVFSPDETHKSTDLYPHDAFRQRQAKHYPKEETEEGRQMKRGKRRIRGSLTVEAAMVFPLFLFAMLVMLGLFTLLQTEQEVTEALHVSARRIAVAYGMQKTADTSEGERAKAADAGNPTGSRQQRTEQDGKESLPAKAASLAAVRAMTGRYLRTEGCWTDSIAGGIPGISYRGSSFGGDYVDLQAEYFVKLPISFWKISRLPVKIRVRARKWTGNSEASETGTDSGWMYVTQYGGAYHKSLSCRYLDLTVRTVSREQVSGLRNKDGGRYYRCGCVKKGSAVVYITDYGTEYHGDSGCRDLSRNIFKVRAGETGARHACKGCCGT